MDWIFYQGSVEQKLKNISHGEITTALDWIVEDMERATHIRRSDATERKEKAMERLAEKHKNDYESGKFSDPLGVAVWKVFGVGLNYDFDHWSELEEGEEPSLYRLRARAAKSAIRRAQEVYDSQGAQIKLDAIDGEEERKRAAAQMQQESETEIKYLTDALTRLIPFNPGTDPRINYDVQLIDKLPPSLRKDLQERKYKKVGQNEYVVDDEYSGYNSAVDSLMKRYGKKTMTSLEDDASQGSSPRTDDEFVDEWLKRRYVSKGDDEDTKSVLA